MAAKKTSDLIPLCHPIAITHVGVELDVVGISADESANTGGEKEEQSVRLQETKKSCSLPFHSPDSTSHSPFQRTKEEEEETVFGRVDITATVACDGKTGRGDGGLDGCECGSVDCL